MNETGRVDSMIDGDAITKLATTVLGDNTTTSTTTFTNQNPTNILKVVSDTPHSREIIDSSTTGRVDQSIASFMAKPISIVTGSITAANLADSLLFRFDIAPQLLSNPMWKDKVNGFMNVRGTARVRLQVNASPFQAGRLILAYIPQYSHSPKTFATHQTSLVTKTQLPHVEMSFQDTECEIEIPYISPTTHYNIITGYYDWGTVFCWVYSPLATGVGGTNQVTYTAWLSFDDFELSSPILPQSLSVRSKKDVIKRYRVNAIKSNIDSEVNEGKGPVSSVLSNVSSIASTLYSVPMLAPIAGPTAWVANMLAGVASAFGWSKPIIDTPVCRMFSNPHAYLANTNNPDLSNNMGMFADNRVTVMPDVNLSGVDEMSLAFIKKQKAYYKTVLWSTTTLPGPLARDEVAPWRFALPHPSAPLGATSDVNPTDYTPVAFLSKLYRVWRGSIEITIKIVKTQYHTGRLIVAFCPASTTGSITNAQTNYVHREIIDLRDGDEFCVSIPYCNNTMYMDRETGRNSVVMMLHVNVLNELVAPETASQSVELLFEVRGGDDLEFQIPTFFNLVPTQYIAPQSGGDDTVAPVLCNSIGGSTIHDPSKLASQLCIGESATSLLQLAKRYCKLSSSLTFGTANRIEIYPYLWGAYFTNGVPTGGSTGALTNDYLSLFASCYAHSRGGVRYRFVSSPVSESEGGEGSYITSLTPYSDFVQVPLTMAAATTNQSLSLNTQDVGGDLDPVNPVNAFDSSYSSGTSLTHPMYGKTFARLNKLSFSNGVGQQYPNDSPCTSTTRVAITNTAGSFGVANSLYRCASDDYQASFWIGVPTLSWLNA